MTGKIVTNLVFLRAQAGRDAKLAEALKELAQKARNEPGNLVYEVQHSMSERDEYLIYGIWRSQTELEAHMNAAGIKAFLEEVSGLTKDALELLLFTPLDIARI